MSFDKLDPVAQMLASTALVVVIIGVLIFGRSISVKMGKAEMRFDSMDDRAKKIQTKTEAAEHQLNGRTPEQTTVSADVSYIRTQLDEIRRNMDAHHQVIASVQTTAAAAAGDAKVVKDVLMRQVGLIAGHQAQLAELSGTVADHARQLDEVRQQHH